MESKSIPDRGWVRVAVVAVVAVAGGFVIWLVVRGNSSSPPAAETVSPARQAPIAGSTRVSEPGLRRLAAVLGTPVYWAGRERGVAYELTKAPDGRTYLRYLPNGVAAGTRKPYLTVGTYPVADALAVTRAAARKQGVVRLAPGAGGVAFYAKSRPTNVYVAFPGSNYQIEVYDPAAAPMHELVAAGRIRPVHSSGAGAVAIGTTAAASSPAALAKLSATLAQPIYWLGRIPGSTYELTRTPDGRVYVRYLPGRRARRVEQAVPDGRELSPRRRRRRDTRRGPEGRRRRGVRAARRGRILLERTADERLRGVPRRRRADRDLRSSCAAGPPAGRCRSSSSRLLNRPCPA